MASTGNVSSSQEDLLSAVIPLLKLLSLTLIGVILAHPKTQLVPRATFKLLSKLVFALFLPCLIFTNLGQSITLQTLRRWWFIPVNVCLSTAIGGFLGYFVALICRPPPEYFRFTIVMTAFGNTGNLMHAIVGSICHSKDNPFGPECRRAGVAYVSFAQWVAVILVYTFVYHMMEPPVEYYELVEEDGDDDDDDDDKIAQVVITSNDVSRPLLHEAEWPGIEEKETEHCKTPFIATVFNSVSNVSQHSVSDHDLIEEGGVGTAGGGERGSGGGGSPRSIRCLVEPRMVRKMRIVAEQTPIRHILQPPTIASLLAIIIGMVPQLRVIVYGDDAPLSFITDSIQILGGAMVPSVMLILGGMLAEGPKPSDLGLRTTVGIIMARLLVLPMIGIGVVVLADRLNLLVEDDDMYRFVLLLQYMTPSAILLGAIASLRGYAVREASAVIFWQHILAVVSISVYIVIYFKLLISYV